jgi:hypothetical protein
MRKILITFLALILFFVFSSSTFAFIKETYIGNPVGTGIRECATLATDPAGCLARDFNVSVIGWDGYSPSDSFRGVVYRILWETSRSASYRENLMRSGNTLRIHTKQCSQSICISRVGGPNDIYLNLRRFTYSASLKKLLVHETGHVLRRRAAQAYSRFDLEEAVRQDPDCYDGKFLKSYSLRTACNGNNYNVSAKSESFAEAISNYQFSGSIGGGFACSQRITNFQTSCDYTYRFMKDNIFGGYNFY